MTTNPEGPTRHILSLSGGKDSTALAIFMRGRIPEMEYVFCDTGEELKETEEYLDKLEVYLGKKIHRLIQTDHSNIIYNSTMAFFRMFERDGVREN